MKIIDRYILKNFLYTFLYSLLLLTLIIMVVDISEKTDDFHNSGLSAWRIFTDYYGGFLPRVDAMLFPLFTFIAVIFFTAKMAGRTEVVAILSSGVSLRRFLMPYWVGGTLLSLVLWWGYHSFLPKANVKWINFESTYIPASLSYTSTFTGRNYYFRIDSNSYAGLRYWDTVSRSGSGFFVQKFAKNRLEYNLRSEYIAWDTAVKKWKLSNVTERSFAGGRETIKRTPLMHTQYNFLPRDLRRDDFLKDRMTTAQLDEHIRIQKLRGIENINEILVERYSRDAIPASVLILALIGAILSSRKVRGGSGFHLAVGVVISVIYILMSRLAVVFSSKGDFPPLLAAWMPNIIFGAVAYYLYKRAVR